MSTKLKPGYKQTEVGVIPEEWEPKPIRKFSAFITKGATPTTYGFRWMDDGVVFLRSECVSDNGLDLAQSMFISGEAHAALSRGEVCSDDILMTITGNVGRVVRLSPDFGYANINQHIARIRVNDPDVEAGFVYHFLSQPCVRAHYASITTGQAYPQISLRQVRETQVPIPRPPEQRAIAGALSDADALIGALDRLIAKKHDLKQAAMQQLLTGQRRLPGFQGEWEVKRVLELGEVVTGGTPRTDVEAFWGDGYPWITPTDISTHRDMFTSERTLTQKGLSAIRALPANTVLVTCIASIGKNAILKTGGGCNQQINAVTPNKNNSAEFLYYVFEASKQYLLANAGTTATSIISKAAFEQLTFKVPPLSEQTAIAAVLSDMDAELAALEQRRDKTRALKQGMMQELLTGRIRLV